MQRIHFRRTEPASGYLEPSDGDIRRCAERVGLMAYSPDFCRDIANVISGGRILPSIEWHDKLKESDFVKNPIERGEGSSIEYEYEYGDGRKYTTYDKRVAQKANFNSAKRAQEAVSEFLRGLEFDNVPGSSPLEKSVNILKTIYDSNLCDSNNPSSDLGEYLPCFVDERGDKASEKVNYLFETVENLDDFEKELLEPPDNTDVQGGEGHGGEELVKMRLADDMSKGALSWLEISRELEQVVRFRISKSDKKTPDNEGDDSQTRQIKSLMELGRIPATEYALPYTYRLIRAANRDTRIRERVSRSDNVQLIYMIIDCSGSMRYGNNSIEKAGGVLFNRLKAVVKEEAVMRFCFFDTKLFPEHVAETPEQARSIMDTFRKESNQGGGTDIDSCLRDAVDRVNYLCKDGTFSEKPELVIVTDGGDTIRLQKSDFSKHNLKLHAFVVGATNKTLVKLARDTGGVASEVE